jgi:hypothetical protein
VNGERPGEKWSRDGDVTRSFERRDVRSADPPGPFDRIASTEPGPAGWPGG